MPIFSETLADDVCSLSSVPAIVRLAVIDPDRAAPDRASGNPCDADGRQRPTDPSFGNGNDAGNAWDRKPLSSCQAESRHHGGKQGDLGFCYEFHHLPSILNC
jgi:hypothetical protein